MSKRDMLELIRSRRSIRQYAEDPPKAEEIEKVFEAGRWAPSGLNNQPWRFLRITDKAKKDGLAALTQYGAIIKEAPITLIVCMDVSDSYNRDKDLMAIGACIQNMLLEAHALGLGACWLGEILNKKQEVKRHLKLDEDLEVMAVITLGRPDEPITQGCRKNLKNLMI